MNKYIPINLVFSTCNTLCDYINSIRFIDNIYNRIHIQHEFFNFMRFDKKNLITFEYYVITIRCLNIV